MPFSTDSRKRSGGGATARPAAPTPASGPTAASKPARVDWLIALAGLVGVGILLAALAFGCTVERVILYETIHYPAPTATP